MTKVGARDRAQLVAMAHKTGLTSPEPHSPARELTSRPDLSMGMPET
jgi:hypothetical protein